MGLNFYVACHRCKTKQFLFRGDESGPMHKFWRKHAECIRADNDACVVQGDGAGEQEWMTNYADDKAESDFDKNHMNDQEAYNESLKVAEQRRVIRVVTLQRLLRISYMQAMRCIDRMLAENRVAALSCETGGLEYHFISPNTQAEGRASRTLPRMVGGKMEDK